MKKIKSVISAAIIGSMLFAFTGCGKIGEIDKKEFKKTVKDVLDCDNDEYAEYDKDDLAKYEDYRARYRGEDSDKYSVSITVYDDEEAAQYFFDSYVNDIEFSDDHGLIDGKVKKTGSYVTVDAEITSGYDGDDYDYYGGVYLAGTTIVRISTTTGKDKHKDTVDELLDALDLPTPARAS